MERQVNRIYDSMRFIINATDMIIDNPLWCIRIESNMIAIDGLKY